MCDFRIDEPFAFIRAAASVGLGGLVVWVVWWFGWFGGLGGFE